MFSKRKKTLKLINKYLEESKKKSEEYYNNLMTSKDSEMRNIWSTKLFIEEMYTNILKHIKNTLT